MPLSSRGKWALLVIGVVAIETPRLISIRQVTGSSMKPTLNPDLSTAKDYVLINKTPVTVNNYRTIRRGDVVTLRSLENPKEINVKRVVGLAGDTVTMRGTNHQLMIPEGRIWVEGDESFRSRDSNAYGLDPSGLVRRRIMPAGPYENDNT